MSVNLAQAVIGICADEWIICATSRQAAGVVSSSFHLWFFSSAFQPHGCASVMQSHYDCSHSCHNKMWCMSIASENARNALTGRNASYLEKCQPFKEGFSLIRANVQKWWWCILRMPLIRFVIWKKNTFQELVLHICRDFILHRTATRLKKNKNDDSKHKRNH